MSNKHLEKLAENLESSTKPVRWGAPILTGAGSAIVGAGTGAGVAYVSGLRSRQLAERFRTSAEQRAADLTQRGHNSALMADMLRDMRIPDQELGDNARSMFQQARSSSRTASARLSSQAGLLNRKMAGRALVGSLAGGVLGTAGYYANKGW